MIVDFGHGMYMEPERELTPHHKRIVEAKPIPRARSEAYTVKLECGHKAHIFGNIQPADKMILCAECRDREGTKA